MVIPSKAAARFAQRYLDLRPTLPKSKRAMTPSGMREARKTAQRKPRDAHKIVAWFARHSTYIIPAEKAGHTPATSKAVGASWGWGHWPMLRDAEKAIAKHERETRSSERRRAR